MAKPVKKKISIQSLFIAYAFLLVLIGRLLTSINPTWRQSAVYCNYGAVLLLTLVISLEIIQSVKKVRDKQDCSKRIDELFVNCNLKGGDEYPSLYTKVVNAKEETYVYRLPAGLSLTDIEKKKDAFEQYLDHPVLLHIDGRLIYISIR